MSMIDKTEIIKMARHVLKRSAGVPDKRFMRPRREWSIGLLFFTIILVSGSAYTATSFNRFRELDTDNGEANVVIPRYRESLVMDVLEDFSARTKTYEELTDTLPVVPVMNVSNTTATATEEVASSTAALIEIESKVVEPEAESTDDEL